MQTFRERAFEVEVTGTRVLRKECLACPGSFRDTSVSRTERRRSRGIGDGIR